MRQVFDLIIQAAPSRSTHPHPGRERHRQGTGGARDSRELVAGGRAFVTVNSGNLPPDLLESTLFGHVKGAFTGAVYPKKGLFDLADKGSIFFDEIGNIPLETQAKLLRVIQEREFMRLGGMETIKVDVRIIAATNVDLRQMMEEGGSARTSSTACTSSRSSCRRCATARTTSRCWCSTSSRSTARRTGRPDLELAPEALDLLMDYDWPGNVRELENVIERAVVLTSGPRIGIELIPDHVRKRAELPDAAVRRAARRDLVQGRDHRLREAADRVDARGGWRRAEARRRAAAHQADDAERDDQAVRHPPAAQARSDGPAAPEPPHRRTEPQLPTCRPAHCGDLKARGYDVSPQLAFRTFAKIRSYLPSTTSHR